MPPETHPWVIWAGVIGAIIAVASVAFTKVREMLRPVAEWVSGWRVRRIERQARIEAAAQILNDQRVSTLSIQLAGVAAQLESVLRQGREEAVRHEHEMSALRAQLTETQTSLEAALFEIAELRAELAEYRGER
ncbi:hypothetical protein ACH47B_13390 [Rhodococcus sp. NPDC019627]|uniref:hypothetical protein n=1 Tax=unclassified Rhodococcus (in: high G+C Gram-positive bacteria) TaxID=192944 RepID=UPI0033F44176